MLTEDYRHHSPLPRPSESRWPSGCWVYSYFITFRRKNPCSRRRSCASKRLLTVLRVGKIGACDEEKCLCSDSFCTRSGHGTELPVSPDLCSLLRDACVKPSCKFLVGLGVDENPISGNSFVRHRIHHAKSIWPIRGSKVNLRTVLSQASRRGIGGLIV